MTTAELIQVILTVVLVLITAVYAWRTFVISKSAGKQADATVQMAKEAEEQRLISTMPTIIQKPILTTQRPFFSHFEVYNAGNGPALELNIAILNEGKDSFLQARRETYVRAGDIPIIVDLPDIQGMVKSQTYYLVAECKSILSRVVEKPLYQTWLPFSVESPSNSEDVFLRAGELDFREVTEEESIEKIINRSKPQ